MYKIGIDARLYSQTGIGVYLRNLLYYLEKITKREVLFYIYLLTDDYNKVKFTNKFFIKRLVHSRWHTVSEQVHFVKTIYQDNLDLMHFTYFSYPVLYKRKFIATIHDTTPLIFKTGKASTRNPLLYEIKFRAFQFIISQQLKNARLVITPSKTVKKQLLDIYGTGYKNKIKPIYEGVDYELKDVERRHSGKRPSENEGARPESRQRFWSRPTIRRTPQNDSRLTKPFFIYVGNFYPHKNIENLLMAFAKVKTDAKLMLIGPDDFFAKRLYRYIDITILDRVIFYHNPSREDLLFFYKNALALIHPSLSEGFGLPLVEAVYFNLPIIASNIEVFTELLNKKYISFDPLSIVDMTEKINFFLQKKQKPRYGNLLNKFSFENLTNKTFNLYQQIIFKQKED